MVTSLPHRHIDVNGIVLKIYEIGKKVSLLIYKTSQMMFSCNRSNRKLNEVFIQVGWIQVHVYRFI